LAIVSWRLLELLLAQDDRWQALQPQPQRRHWKTQTQEKVCFSRRE
jgi:hypothetical protein